MAFVPIAWVCVGAAGAAYGLNSGVFAKWSGFSKSNDNNNGNNGSSNNSQTLPAPSQQPQVIVYETPNNNNGSNRILPITGTALAILAGYYYYIHKHGTKKVINKVEETSQQTQDLVSKSDKNNEKRFTELDSRNTERAHTLETEIRSEARAGFEVVSDQLYCLTQICLQTLTSIAHGNNSNNAGEFGNNRVDENLLSYCESAQQTADTLISEDHLMKKRSDNLNSIRAEIHARNPNTSGLQPIHVTAGGPDGNTPMGPSDSNNNNNNGNRHTNVFDMDANQTAYLTNISYKDSKHNLDELNDSDNNNNTNNKNKMSNNESTMSKVLNYLNAKDILPEKLKSIVVINNVKNDIEENKNLIISGGCAMVACYFGWQYFAPNNNQPRYYSKYNDTTNNNRN